MASRLFTQPFVRAQIKEKFKSRVTGLCEGNSRVTGEFPANSPHKGPVTRKMFPFAGVIMKIRQFGSY